MLVGRKRELDLLQKYHRSDQAELVAVYGRRRVGKTYLIRQAFGDDFFFYFTGVIGAGKAEQLERFSKALKACGAGIPDTAGTWMQAFDSLSALIRSSKSKRKKVIFFDEMPWLDNPKSGFLNAFDYFWNAFASARNDILFIVCGSATSWITQNLFRNRGGLHNRVTGKIHLNPFTLHECEAFFKSRNVSLNRYDIIESYMVFGGIPYYLGYFENNYSLAGNVDNIVFSENAPLKEEFQELYASLFKKSEHYTEVVEALSRKTRGMTRDELVAATKHKNGGTLTKILEDLELSGFIRKYYAFPNKVNGALYQLIDSFSLFYFSFMRRVHPTDVHYWTGLRDSPRLNAWRGYAFELVCFRHIEQIRAGLGIAGVLIGISSWRSRRSDPGAQIDLVIERGDNVIDLCEIKFSKHPYSIGKGDEEDLRNKLSAFTQETKTRKAVHIAMITTYGVKQNMHAGIVNSQVTMDALFRPD
ncbi:MAG: AAA family ATPase [Clostridiales Family XIII bacterium]|jgi:AAA+ ATPase superfamily predicted ATPase|nr:AAA family ATPase [Clostridiales Family XIII bacterium]